MKLIIGFSKNKKSLFSKIISYVQGTPYSHIYIRKQSRYGEYIYHASNLQVNFMYIDTFLKDNIIIKEYEYDIDNIQNDKLISFCIKHSGKPYSICSIFKIFIMLLFKKFNKKIKFKNSDGQNAFICSELIAYICNVIFNLNINNLDYITPKEMEVILENLYGQTKKKN